MPCIGGVHGAARRGGRPTNGGAQWAEVHDNGMQ